MGSSLSGSAQVDHRLQMEGLGKQVGECSGLDLVSRSEQCAQIASQCCRIAGDVSQFRCANLRQQTRDLRPKASAWRIDNDEVRSLALAAPVPVQKVESRGTHSGPRRPAQVLLESCHCRGSRLNCNHARKAFRQPSRKQPDPCEQVPRDRTLFPAVTASTSPSTSHRFTWKKAPWSTR